MNRRLVRWLVGALGVGVLAALLVGRGSAATPTPQIEITPSVVEVTSQTINELGVSWTARIQNLIDFLPNGSTQVESHPAPSANAGLGEIVAGGRGKCYFVEVFVGKIGSFDTKTGAIAEFAPSFPLSGQFGPIGWGPDKKLWIGENAPLQNKVWITRLDPATGIFDPEFVLPLAKSLADLKRGPGGDMFATDIGGNALFRITSALVATRFPLPTPSVGSYWGWIAEGCVDGLLWFTHSYYVDAFDGSKFSEYDPPSAGALPFGITMGKDRNVWFTTLGTNQIGRLDVSPLATGGMPVFTLWGPYTPQLGGILPIETPRMMIMPLTRGSAFNPGPTPTVPPVSACPAPSFSIQVFPNATTSQLGKITFPPSPSCPPEPTRPPQVLRFDTMPLRYKL